MTIGIEKHEKGPLLFMLICTSTMLCYIMNIFCLRHGVTTEFDCPNFICLLKAPSIAPTTLQDACAAIQLSCGSPFDGRYVQSGNVWISNSGLLSRPNNWLITGTGLTALSNTGNLGLSTWTAILGSVISSYSCGHDDFFCVAHPTRSPTDIPTTTPLIHMHLEEIKSCVI